MTTSLVDHIFQHKNSWYRITGEPRKSIFINSESYPVRKCNKNGKLFKEENGFDKVYVEKLHKEGKLIYVGNTVEEVSTDGIAIGVKKRRIQHLEAEIISHIKEYNQLQQELGNTNRLDIKYI